MGSDDREEPILTQGVNRTRDFMDIVPNPVGADDPSEFRERAKSRGRPTAVIVGVLVGVAVAGAVGWLALNSFSGGGDMPTGEAPLIEAEDGPVKVRPDDPGGLDIPNRDRKVYETIDPSNTATLNQPERLAPPPPEPRPLAEVEPMPAPPMPETTMKDMPVPDQPPPSPGAATDGSVAELVTKAESKPVPKVEPKPVEVPKVVETAPAPKPAPAPKIVSVTPAQPAQPSGTTTSSGAESKKALSGAFLAQLLASRDATGAEQAWANLLRKHGDILGKYAHVVVRADLGAKGIYYRLRVGPFADKAGAGGLCSALKTRKVGCLVVANK